MTQDESLVQQWRREERESARETRAISAELDRVAYGLWERGIQLSRNLQQRAARHARLRAGEGR